MMASVSTSEARRWRVVAVLPPGAPRDAVVRGLDRGAYDLELVTTAQLPRSAAAGVVDVVLFDWCVLGSDAHAAFARLQAQAPDVAFVAVVDRTPFAEIASIFEAGVNDVIRTPLQIDELRARLQRAAQAASSSAKAKKKPPPPALPCLDRLPTALSADLSAFAGAALGASARVPDELRCADDVVVTCLPLHEVHSLLEVRVLVAARRCALRELAHRMFDLDDADEACCDDLTREMANLAAGALKRICSQGSSSFTMGLPRHVEGGCPDRDHWVTRLCSDDGGVDVAIFVETLRRAPSFVDAAHLREGMVVVADLKTDDGTLLLSAGSRLSVTTVGRISGILGQGRLVEILDPAVLS